MLTVLWISIAIMLLSILIPEKILYRKLIAAFGWIILALYWAFKPVYYLSISDYINTVLVIVLCFLSLMIAYRMILEYKKDKYTIKKNEIDITYMITNAVTFGCLFYFMFAEIPTIRNWLIDTVTNHIMWILNILNIPVERSGNMLTYNDRTVEIVLACTAIESISLFIGLIASVKAPIKRLISAFMISVPVIYILNIIRDVFVVIAYGRLWFGPNSFEIAHHMIAKAGSGIALFIIAYMIMHILPEILQLIEGLWNLNVENMQYLRKRITGK